MNILILKGFKYDWLKKGPIRIKDWGTNLGEPKKGELTREI